MRWKSPGIMRTMNKTVIRSVVFDYGGVLSKDQDKKLRDKMSACTNSTPDEFSRIYYGKRHNYDRGTMSGADYWHSFKSRRGDDLTEEEIAELINWDNISWGRINEATLSWVLELKRLSFNISILSNMPFDFEAYLKREHDWVNEFCWNTFSCQVKYIKPEAQIYRICVDKLQVKPGQIVFFDDREDNVAAARREGIEAFLFSSVSRAREDLEGVLGR
ncbi:MAG: HAD family phosphatase [Spirochaetales bacterium]|nr:HAD family phosphatase [Spirochaetales bacterium]